MLNSILNKIAERSKAIHDLRADVERKQNILDGYQAATEGLKSQVLDLEGQNDTLGKQLDTAHRAMTVELERADGLQVDVTAHLASIENYEQTIATMRSDQVSIAEALGVAFAEEEE